MEKITSPLFQNLTDAEWSELRSANCLRVRHFARNTIIFHAGDTVHETGIVLSGSVNIEASDLLGNKSILSNIPPGGVFAETYSFCQEPMMVDAVSVLPSEVLFLNMELLTGVYAGTARSSKILQNMLHISIHKNLTLSTRILCTTPKTIRGRLLIYLSALAAKRHSSNFQIPFNRQQLADYLNLDRSALSKELGKMREEGILEFHKNHFILRQLPE